MAFSSLVLACFFTFFFFLSFWDLISSSSSSNEDEDVDDKEDEVEFSMFPFSPRPTTSHVIFYLLG